MCGLDIEGRFAIEISFLEDRKPIKFLQDSALHGNTGQIPERYDMRIEFIEMNQKIGLACKNSFIFSRPLTQQSGLASLQLTGVL